MTNPDTPERCGAAAESGTATIPAALLSAALIVALIGIMTAMSVISATHTARGIADLTALAGAGRALGGTETACQAAAEIAARNNAELRSCHQHLLDITVEVSVPARIVGQVTARATAGPAEDTSASSG